MVTGLCKVLPRAFMPGEIRGHILVCEAKNVEGGILMRPTQIFTALVVLIAATAAGGEMPFSSAQGLWHGIDGPSSVDAADLNRDGYVDVAVTTIEADDVSIRFGGPSPWVVILETDFEQGCYVKTADVNGDGWVDVVASNRGDASLQVCWWQNPGDAGGTWPRRTVATGEDFTQSRSVEVGDLDGDGDADIVVAGIATTMSYITWYENADGDGTAWNSWDVTRWYVTFFEGPHDTVIVDINRDGRPDVAAVAYDEDEVAWFENDGTIHNDDCWPMHTVATNFDGAVCVAAADMDDDGDSDIIAGAYRDGYVRWFENRVNQALSWVSHDISFSLDGVYTVQPVDMDLDGDLDVLAAGRDADRVIWYERATASLWLAREIDGAFDGARSAVAADFDDDGDLDVIAAGEFDWHVSWWENLSIHYTARFEVGEPVEDALTNPQSVQIADVDRDGDLDIVGTLYNYESSRPDVAVWKKAGATWERFTVESELNGATAVRVADINGDLLPDLVVAGAGSNRVNWYEGNDSLGFYTRTVATGIAGAKDVAVADFDCDGDLDIAAIASLSGDVLWFENDGGYGSSWIEHTINNFSGATALTAADIDCDGNPDLVVADDYNDQVWALPHFGCGTVWGEFLVAGVFDGAKDVEVADFNGDGWPDVVAAGEGANTVAVMLRDSSDWIWDRHDVDTSFNAWGVAAADVNHDGHVDIVGASRSGGDVRWWRNYTGDGTFWVYPLALDTDLAGARAVAVGDISEDGFLDVVAAGTTGDLVKLYESNPGQSITSTHDVAPETIGNSETAAILRISPLHGGLATDPDMELRNIGILIDDGYGIPLITPEVNAIIESVQVWLDDNNNGFFDASEDTMLNEVDYLALSSGGFATVGIPHGGANPRINPTLIRTFFLVVTTTSNASSIPTHQFRISHWKTAAALAHYYDDPDMQLRPIDWEPVYSRTVTCTAPSALIFADGFEGGSTDQWTSTTP